MKMKEIVPIGSGYNHVMYNNMMYNHVVYNNMMYNHVMYSRMVYPHLPREHEEPMRKVTTTTNPPVTTPRCHGNRNPPPEKPSPSCPARKASIAGWELWPKGSPDAAAPRSLWEEAW